MDNLSPKFFQTLYGSFDPFHFNVDDNGRTARLQTIADVFDHFIGDPIVGQLGCGSPGSGSGHGSDDGSDWANHEAEQSTGNSPKNGTPFGRYITDIHHANFTFFGPDDGGDVFHL